MDETIFIIPGIIVILFVIMAIFLLNGKGAFLIAGYNTASKDEKAKYDEKALCRFVGWLLIGISICCSIIPAGDYFEITWLTYCGIALIFLISVGGIIYANSGNRFRRNAGSDQPDANVYASKQASKPTVIAVIIISLVVLPVIGVMLYQGGKDPVVNVLDDGIQIKGIYGLGVEFSEISGIDLVDKSMKDIGTGRRTNGYGGIGRTLKGHFKSDSLGEIMLFVQSKSSPTIRIERRDSKDIYLSFHDGEKTVQLYHEMKAALK